MPSRSFSAGVVQILVIALGMRFFRVLALERTTDDKLVGVDRVYTILNKLGIVPLAVFELSDHQPDGVPFRALGFFAVSRHVEQVSALAAGQRARPSFLVYFIALRLRGLLAASRPGGRAFLVGTP